MNEAAILFYGLLIGARHALEPDHVSAVSTMAAHGRSLKETARITMAWGLGHTTLIALIGIAFIALKLQLPAWIQHSGEGLVGIMMILMGAHVFWRMRLARTQVVQHAHAGATHSHVQPPAAHPGGEAPWMRRPLTAYLTGSVHGLAGSGAAIAIALSAAPSQDVALLYLVVFGLGSVAGMAALGVIAMWPLVMLSSRVTWTRNVMQGLAGSASMFLGAILLAETLG